MKTSRWAAAFLGIAVSFVVMGAWAFERNAAYSGLFRTAFRIETRQPVSWQTVERVAPRAHGIVDAGVCRDDIVRAAVTVATRGHNRHSPAIDYDGWQRSAEAMVRLLEHAAACNPADGNRWALLAFHERSIAETPERLAALLSLSARLAPAEIGVLRTRMAVWNRASAATLERGREALVRDVATLVGYGTDRDIVAAAGNARGEVRTLVRREAAKLPRERLLKMAAAGGRIFQMAGPVRHFREVGGAVVPVD